MGNYGNGIQKAVLKIIFDHPRVKNHDSDNERWQIHSHYMYCDGLAGQTFSFEAFGKGVGQQAYYILFHGRMVDLFRCDDLSGPNKQLLHNAVKVWLHRNDNE